MADPVTAEQPSKPTPEPIVSGAQTRKEKRKSLKKLKRQRIRREAAIREREEEEARANDPEEQLRIKLKEQEEAEVSERARKEFEERERLWLEAAAKRKAEEEERKQQRLLEESEIRKNRQGEHGNELEEYDEWDYVEDGPPEIICQGNEIIIKKKRVKVAKNSADRKPDDQDADRPTSNPLPPQSVAFASYNSEKAVSAQELLEGVAQQVPNFGTEQDKAHCPFHLKTGACRFGTRCSRAHFYPDKSCTLLIKNMYNGPGLVWEQDEVLEYTDEEVDRCYEDFYEDVHTEFLKFGELVNFKVCKNGAYHLRGNVYVHYKLLESAILAYNTMNGRYFAGKQITCEFVGVTRWKVAICGEYMKTRLRTCSHGTACNFIHCFRNPGGDYEWADWDKPPPKYWIRKMAVLFGHSDESSYGKQMEHDNFEGPWDSSRKRTPINGRRYHSRSPHDAVEVHVSKRDPHSSRAATRERSRRRNETSSLHESEHYERKHKSETHDYDINNHSHGHASSDSRSKEKDTESQNNYRKNEAHQREKNNHSTKQERSSRRKREDLSDKQERSETKHRSKSSKRRREENVLSDHPSDSSEGKRNRSSSRSSEEYYYRHSIDADDRYNGKRRKVIKQEVNDDRYTSTEFPDRWEATEEISDCEETHEKPKRHRGKRKHESFDKSDSDEALDGRAHRKHSRSQTHTRRSSSSEKRTQGRSHKS